MQEQNAYYVETKANGSHDENQLRFLNLCLFRHIRLGFKRRLRKFRTNLVMTQTAQLTEEIR